jgi:hypothetical protein
MRAAFTFFLFAYPYYFVMLAQKKSKQPVTPCVKKTSSKKGNCEAPFIPDLPIPYGFLRFSHCHARPFRIAQSCIFLLPYAFHF